MQHCFLLSRKLLRFQGSAMGIAIANRKNRCGFGALRCWRTTPPSTSHFGRKCQCHVPSVPHWLQSKRDELRRVTLRYHRWSSLVVTVSSIAVKEVMTVQIKEIPFRSWFGSVSFPSHFVTIFNRKVPKYSVSNCSVPERKRVQIATACIFESLRFRPLS